MICPNDGSEMHPVRIVAHYGEPIVVDQCRTCGGIWFDQWELFGAKQGEAQRIEELDADALRAPSSTGQSALVCPRDGTVMHRFTEKRFPEDIVLVRCLSCHGIWLNRGLFTRYQQFRNELMRPKETGPQDRELSERIGQLVESYQSGRSSQTLRELGEFLSTPIGTGSSMSSGNLQKSDSANAIAGAAISVLMALLRAFALRP